MLYNMPARQDRPYRVAPWGKRGFLGGSGVSERTGYAVQGARISPLIPHRRHIMGLTGLDSLNQHTKRRPRGCGRHETP